MLSVGLTAGISKINALGPENSSPIDKFWGTWTGKIVEKEDPIELRISASAKGLNSSSVVYFGGCMSIGQNAPLMPITGMAERGDNPEPGKYKIKIYGNLYGEEDLLPFSIKGTILTYGPAIFDDEAEGGILVGNDINGPSWEATHHDLQMPVCPSIDLDSGYYLNVDTYAAIAYGTNSYARTQLEAFTNIPSAGVKVQKPDGESEILPLFTDIFTPEVDLDRIYRFIKVIDGMPVDAGTYIYTLLDASGKPIKGATTQEIWFASHCQQGAPSGVTASIQTSGIWTTWNPVEPAPGFDPSAGIGFYQISLFDGAYGAHMIPTNWHLIPFYNAGSYDHGTMIGYLPNNNYGFEVVSFSDDDQANGAKGYSCQKRNNDESVEFTKTEEGFTILQ